MSRQINAIVTGAAGGIGSAVARRLAETGANVVATDLNASAVKAFVREHGDLPGRLVPTAGDITKPEFASEVVQVAVREFGSLNVLVNSSGWLKDARIEDMPIETFKRLLEVNFVGPMRLAEASLQAMAPGGWGRIISLASRAWLGNFGSSGYSAAKGAIVGASRALSLRAAGCGVTVNCIAPGFIDTPMSRSMPADIVDRVIGAIPVRRAGTVDDVSALVEFLVGKDSGYVTGQTWLACGGRSISNPIAKPTATKEGTE